MENRTSKYFKYAIGEIVLVVIGILIALQINNWNENINNNLRKKEMLEEIHHEFVINKEKLEFIEVEHKKCYAFVQEVLNMLPINDSVRLDVLRDKMIGSFGNWTFDPLQTRIKSFISSPDFNLIEDKNIQDLLISWESVYEDYHEDEQLALDYNYNILYPYLQKYFPRKLDLNDPRFDKSILKSIEFENCFERRMRTLQDILYNDTNELEILKNTIQKIVDLTESYTK